ncbi:MAG: pyrroline-5-carboxylate reductase [Eubacteriales bacterium]
MQKVGFIGTGNMGAILASAVAKSDCTLYYANRSPEKPQKLAKNLGGTVTTNEEIATQCSLIFLGVKPQMMGDMLKPLAPLFKERTDPFVLVTMAAGLTCETIATMAGGDYPVIRIMPNTPSSVGAGMNLYCGHKVSAETLDRFATLLAPTGMMDLIDESQMDAAGCVAGCGPAFYALFVEGLAQGGVACGLTYEQAVRYATQTMIGTGQKLLAEQISPEALRIQVCSPKGSTLEGVAVFEQGNSVDLGTRAVSAAYHRTLELGKLL